MNNFTVAQLPLSGQPGKTPSAPVRYIDLHVHTTASDGTDLPTELVRKAAALGISVLAITDHDTVSGIEEARLAGEQYGVEVIGGCEIAVQSDFGELHILGLFASPENPKLLQYLDVQRERRMTRNLEILGKLNRMGIPLLYEEVLQYTRGQVCGRPHIACALVGSGFAGSVTEAFARFVGEHGAAYSPRVLDSPEVGIQTLLDCGTLPVFAHPCLSPRMDKTRLSLLLREFKDYGLAGVEAFHSKHSADQTGMVLRLARKYDLCVSGGSDYHGTNKPAVFLGYACDGRKIEYSLLESIKEACQKPT